jgi:hypothetical protein
MATRLASNTPHTLSPWLSQMVAISSMPLSLVFTPDAYYFGVLPVFAEAAASVGRDPLTIGRAAILGQMTTGFPLSPLTASTFILLGLSGVSLQDTSDLSQVGVRHDGRHDYRGVHHGEPFDRWRRRRRADDRKRALLVLRFVAFAAPAYVTFDRRSSELTRTPWSHDPSTTSKCCSRIRTRQADTQAT